MSASDTERSTSARAIGALAASRRRSHMSPAPSIASSDMDDADASTFNPDNDDALMSTKHQIDEDDSHFLPKIRSTAANRRFYNPVQQPNVQSSAVRQHFQDFDHSNSTDGEDDSLEIGRGGLGLGHTPSKPNKSLDSEILMEIGNSHYESARGTPPSKMQSRHQTPKSNLRKEAQLRRASSTRVNGVKENSAPEYTNTRPTRMNGRTVSETYPRNSPMNGTPQRGTPRGVANSTLQSFAIPDMHNITDLFPESLINGSTGLPRNGFSNRRVVSTYASNAPNGGHFIPVGGIPIPEEEKAILASLQLLKDRLAQVEQENAEKEQRLEEYELHVANLEAKLDAASNLRRSDSALGSSDGEGVGKQTKWKLEKAQLETSVAQMQRKFSQAETNIKRLTSERDTLADDLSAAYFAHDALKVENEAALNDNRLLQDRVTDLETENRALTAEIEELRAQFDNSHDRHEDETRQWVRKEKVLEKKANSNDRAILQENQTLREELVRKQHEQEAAARQEKKARREAERAAKAEHAKLADENEQLRLELEERKAAREAGMEAWKSKQDELQARVEQREETIHALRGELPQEAINDDIRKENEILRAEIAAIKARGPAPATSDARPEQTQREADTGTPKEILRKRLEEVTNLHLTAGEKWERKTTRLTQKLEQAREVNDLYRELDDARNGGNTTHTRPTRRSIGQAQTQAQTRSRSKSQTRRTTRTEVPRPTRHVSAPVTTREELEAESTSDMSFDPAILAGAPRSGGKGSRATGFVPARELEKHTGDTTYLSYINSDAIADLRRRIEEEHLAARARQARATTVEDDDEVEITGYGPRVRRGSMKSATGRSRASSHARSAYSVRDDDEEAVDFEDATIGTRAHSRMDRNDTIHSRISHASRSRSRRRSSAAYQEMTSAFIIPDITLHTDLNIDGTGNLTSKDILTSLKGAAHDAKNCSVCQRILSSFSVNIEDLEIPAIVPVTDRASYKNDIDATLRPSQPPAQALKVVIKQLQDELQHLKLEFMVLTNKVNKADPAMGKRALIALHAKIAKLNRAMQAKEGQLYALHDVVEAHKVDLHALEDTELPEEVERTLDNVLADRGRKVVFDGDESSEGSGIEWGGVSDTEGL